MAGFDRSRISGGLNRRTQQQTDTRESGGGIGRQGFMDYSTHRLKFFKMGDPGTYHDLNILPWVISSKKHPEVVAKHANIGDPDYVLDLMVHTRIGPNNGDYICPKKNFGLPCPICEYADELNKNPQTKKEAKDLFAKRKCVYLVQELTDTFHAKSEDPMVFEVSHAVFSKDLQSRATSCLRGKGVVNFADPDVKVGKVVSFSVNEESMGDGRKFKKAANFEFNERAEEISDEILEKCPSLDSMMVIKTYDQLKAALFGDPEDDEEGAEEPQEAEAEQPTARFRDNAPADYGDEEPAQGRRRRPVAEEAEEPAPTRRRPQAEPAEEEQEAPAPTRRRPVAEPEAEQPSARFKDNEPPAEGDFDIDTSADPYTAARRNSRKAAVEQDSSKETVRKTEEKAPAMPFDEEEEQPAQKVEKKAEAPKREAAEGECPNGYEYGKDCERQPLCSRCPDPIWSKCDACRRRMNRK